MTTHFEEPIRLKTDDADLCLRHEPAASTPKAVVMICHGLAEHSLRYQPFAEYIAARGYHVYAHDHRGHGLTRAPDAPLGRFAKTDGAALVIADVHRVRSHIGALHPGLPVLLFGHSMGGMIALNAAEKDARPFAGLSVFNSNLNPGLAGHIGMLAMKSERFFKGSDVPSLVGPKATFDVWGKSITGASTPFDWLSRDPQAVAAYMADPLCGVDASVSMWLDIMTLSFGGGRSVRLARLPKDLPVYLVGGGQDPATNKGEAILWLERKMKSAGMRRVNTVIYSEMRHETLNELGREEAMRNYLAWADGVVAKN